MSEKVEKLTKALRNPDSAFKAVANTVRQSAADIVADLATALRAMTWRMTRLEAEIEELKYLLKEAVDRVPNWSTGVNEEWRERARGALEVSNE